MWDFCIPCCYLAYILGGVFIPYVYHVYMSSSWGYLYPTAMLLMFGLFIAYFSHVYIFGLFTCIPYGYDAYISGLIIPYFC